MPAFKGLKRVPPANIKEKKFCGSLCSCQIVIPDFAVRHHTSHPLKVNLNTFVLNIHLRFLERHKIKLWSSVWSKSWSVAREDGWASISDPDSHLFHVHWVQAGSNIPSEMDWISRAHNFRGFNSDDFPIFETSLGLLEAELAPFKDWAKSSSSSSLL